VLDEGIACRKFVAQCWNVYAKPTANEGRFITALERRFPGSEWVQFASATINGEPKTLEMVVIGPGPGPKNVLATDGVVYPYRKFKGLRGREVGPPSASTLSGLSKPESALSAPRGRVATEAGSDALPSGGTGAQYSFAVVGSKTLPGPELDAWIESLPKGATIITCEPKWRKDSTPMNSEALLLDTVEGHAYVPPLYKDRYGTRAKECQVEAVLCGALGGGTVVLIGKGTRVTAARDWLKRMAGAAPPVVEIGV